MQEEEIKLGLIQWIAETNDVDSIKKIQTIRNSSIHLTAEQESILEKRMEKYEQGLMKFSSWNEVKNKIK
jgi:hypothetical protein